MLEPAAKPSLTAYSRTSIQVTTTSFVSTGLSVVLSPNTLYLIDFGSRVSDTGDGLEFKLEASNTTDSGELVYEVDGAASRLILGTTHVIAPSSYYILRMWGSVKTAGLVTLTLFAKKTTDLNDPTSFNAGVYLNARPV